MVTAFLKDTINRANDRAVRNILLVSGLFLVVTVLYAFIIGGLVLVVNGFLQYIISITVSTMGFAVVFLLFARGKKKSIGNVFSDATRKAAKKRR